MELGPLSRAVRQLRRMVGGLTTAGPSDRQLLEAFVAGDRAVAFERLVERHGSMVHGVCRRVLGNDADADDAFQATFLVLARKATSSMWQDSVANWLYGVAYRTSLRVRCRNAHRRFHETRASRSKEFGAGDGVDWQEVRAVLDEELMRLPEKFRMPLVLCCLHDHTVEETAATLSLPATTIKGRLQQGRELLRLRLVRRGITVGVGVLSVAAPAGMASAVPAALVLSTIDLAARGSLTGPIAALANEVMYMTTWLKLKVGAALCGFCLLFGGGAMILRTEATPLPASPSETLKAAPKEPVASEPVVSAGLAVTVKPTKAVFGPGEVPTVEVTYTNKLDEAFNLYDLGFEVRSWDCQRTGDSAAWRSGPYEYAARGMGKATTLEAGKSVTVRATIRPAYTWQGVQYRAIPPRETLPTGTYKAVARIMIPTDPTRAAKEAPNRYWTGELTTKPIEFEISDKAEGAKPSEPVEKDGLQVTVAPSKAVFAPGERILLTIAYVNKSDKAFILNDIGGFEVQYWDCQKAGDTGPWRSAPSPRLRREPGTIIELTPGKMATSGGEIWPTFTWQGLQRKPVADRDQLPIGKYQIVAHIALNAPPNAGTAPYWVGELTTKPVEIQIGDKAEGAKASEPAMKNGLAVTVKPTKAIFALGEAPKFEVTYTNRAETLTIQLHRLGDEVDRWNFARLDAAGAWEYDVAANNAAKERELPSPLLEPGKEKERTCTAWGPFLWKGEQEQPIARDHLPPGKYRGTALLRFPDSAIKAQGIVSWSGELTTKPVEFEVSDQKADAGQPSRVITEADKGKTIPAKIGDIVEVRLENEKPLTGWEGGALKENKLIVDPGVMRFVPSPTKKDPQIGTFIFRHVVVQAGQASLEHQLVSPGGPGFQGVRERTALLREFKITLQAEK